MTKIQKIWLWILIALIALPEIVWSPVLKFTIYWSKPLVKGHYFVWRENLLDNNPSLWSNLLLIQFFGFIFLAIFIFLIREKFKNKGLFYFLLFIVLFLSIIMFYIQGLSRLTITI